MRICPLIFWLLLSLPGWVSGQAGFVRAMGSAKADWGASILQNADGTYLLSGETLGMGTMDMDLCLVKTTKSGDVLWQKLYGGGRPEFGGKIIRTKEGGLAMVGTTNSYGSGSGDILLVKLTQAGIVEWKITFGSRNEEEGTCLVQTADQGYIVAGTTIRSDPDNPDIMIIKTNDIGETEWTYTLDSMGFDKPKDMIISKTGEIIVTGYLGGTGPEAANPFILFLSPKGKLKRIFHFPGTEGPTNSYFSSIIETADSNFVVTKYGALCGLEKIDRQGNVIWSVPGFCGKSVIASIDNQLVVTGVEGNAHKTMFLAKFSREGRLIWETAFKNYRENWGLSLIQTFDGGYAVIGWIEGEGEAAEPDIVFIKTDAFGRTETTTGAAGGDEEGEQK